MDKLLSGRRALVVEDEMLVLIMIEDMLADLGCRSVTAAAAVEKAVALMWKRSPRSGTVCLLDRQHRSEFERRLLRSSRAKNAI